MSMLTGTTLDWFISLPDGHVTSFAQLSKLFRKQYIANQAPPPISYDIFDVRQYQGELEGVPQLFWGTGGEAEQQGRDHDGTRVSEGDRVGTLQ